MLVQKMPHYVDSVLTKEKAATSLQGGGVEVALYTNQSNSQSVVHSHPYYELILPMSGSSVRYSVGGSVYDLHLGELILFSGEVFHSGKFNITADTSERLVVQISPNIWEKALAQSGLTERFWGSEPVILLRTLQRELLLLVNLKRQSAHMPLRALFDKHRVWQNRRGMVGEAINRLSGDQLRQAVTLLTHAELTLKQDYGQSIWAELESLSLLLCHKALADVFIDG